MTSADMTQIAHSLCVGGLGFLAAACVLLMDDTDDQ